jgi:radical SAM protein with 4Fe4S-binding SPASM domain
MNPKGAFVIDAVCSRYCSYYKPDRKEDTACEGFNFFQRLSIQTPAILASLRLKQNQTFTDRYHHLLYHALCKHCDFLIDDCDFTDPDCTGDPLPCGGYVAADLLLEASILNESQLTEMLTSEQGYVALRDDCVVRQLESPYLYDISNDELYELDQQGVAFLTECNGTRQLAELSFDKDFLETCLKEGLIVVGPRKDARHFKLGRSPIPSLRYLELQLTSRCNLTCGHCYLGEQTRMDLPLASVLSVLDEFEQMQGLRVLFSGGEPLMYPDLRALNEALPRYGLRKVLLTNGTMVSRKNYADWGHFDEVQFSLDGLQNGHERIRGAGTFDAVMDGMDAVREKGIPISIATMVHRYNLEEFEMLAEWVGNQEILEWSIDVPCTAGRLLENLDLLPTPEEAAPFLRYATGGSYHGGNEPFACGYHLCTVTPEGTVLKCGFFGDRPLGSLEDGLEASWKRIHPVPLSDLECASCPHLLDCKGGCRFRAESFLGKDPIMCALYGVPKNV